MSALAQSSQDTGPSWQYALLLPPWELPISSPCRSIGTPRESTRVARSARDSRARSARTSGSPVGPSTPQFHDRLSSRPSRSLSPFASLCLWSYDHRSRTVKPSWAVTKLIEAAGRRPVASNRSEEPAIRVAKSARVPGLPRQKSRTVSR